MHPYNKDQKGFGMNKLCIIVVFLVMSTQAYSSSIHKTIINKPISEYYPELKKAIEANRMHVIYEMDLLKKFKESGYAKKFGKDFNKNKVEVVKTLLICNGYVGNQVSNIDPRMMVLCPIKITLIQRDGKTTVTFVKSASLAKNKDVKALLVTLDEIIVHTINLTNDNYMRKSI